MIYRSVGDSKAAASWTSPSKGDSSAKRHGFGLRLAEGLLNCPTRTGQSSLCLAGSPLGTWDFASFHKSPLHPCPRHLRLCDLHSPLTSRLVPPSALILLFFSGFGAGKKSKQLAFALQYPSRSPVDLQPAKCQGW